MAKVAACSTPGILNEVGQCLLVELIFCKSYVFPSLWLYIPVCMHTSLYLMVTPHKVNLRDRFLALKTVVKRLQKPMWYIVYQYSVRFDLINKRYFVHHKSLFFSKTKCIEIISTDLNCTACVLSRYINIRSKWDYVSLSRYYHWG